MSQRDDTVNICFNLKEHVFNSINAVISQPAVLSSERPERPGPEDLRNDLQGSGGMLLSSGLNSQHCSLETPQVRSHSCEVLSSCIQTILLHAYCSCFFFC